MINYCLKISKQFITTCLLQAFGVFHPSHVVWFWHVLVNYRVSETDVSLSHRTLDTNDQVPLVYGFSHWNRMDTKWSVGDFYTIKTISSWQETAG